MSAFDFVIIIGAVCGLVMVGGAIWLLRTGVIKLREKAEDGEGHDALEAAIDQIKIGTRYPAIALFVIGLFFVMGSTYFSRTEVLQIPVHGVITSEEKTYVSDVKIGLYLPVQRGIPISRNGELQYTFVYLHEPNNLVAELLSPGYREHGQTVLLTKRNGGWYFEFELGKPVAQKPKGNFNVDP